MTKKFYLLLICTLTLSVGANAQFGKLKGMLGGKKDTTKTAEADSNKKVEKEKGGGNFFSKAIIKVAKASSGLVMSATGMLVTTDDLNSVTPMVSSSVNLAPASVGTAEMSFFNGWKSNGNLTTVFFTQKGKMGIAKVDGNVMINGRPADYVSTGIYLAFTENNGKPASVEITTKSGQKANFTVPLIPSTVKIKSINGQTGDNVTADLTKDMVIEFEKLPGSENIPMRANIVITQIGIRAFYPVANFKGADKLVIPAAAFRNINITPGGKALYSFKNCYLSIDRYQPLKTTNVSGVIPPLDFTGLATDGRYLTLTGEPALNLGLTAKGEEKFAAGEVEYNFFKPNAFLSRPFGQLKNMGIMSFSVRGTTYVQGKSSKSSSSYSVGSTTYTTTTTTSTWATFPKVSDDVWAGLLDNLYSDFTTAATQELQASLVPVTAVTGAEAYRDMEPYSKDDETTNVSFFHNYKDTKMLSAYLPLAEGFSANSGTMRLLKQTGTQGMMKFTFDLQIAIEKGNPVMIPKLAFEILGAKNGDLFDTKFCSATLVGKGVRFPSGNITVADMQKIIRQSDLLATFRKGLQEIKAKETANGDYNVVWALQ
ncbi:hypothetical protein [Mucilaginibacter myungsuensis]|uniref:GLPGLI family protein n=1 Tax=Mucilaginibacter myungsuensis TaxID=649104 RepID=A0A929L6I1_9SPHI|nr:hypothetical protein [Mucilaginibacter myungsuensis]MBE9664096.1 hypothetical protein [Mucilaginibacter myungsuensis]MDN3601275.1 hypothetical protein [Mucilaginibacter myungsuensis]